MLNKIMIVLLCSVFVVGCNCKSKSSTPETKTVYDVKCYEGGTLIMDTTTDRKPTVTTGNTYWTGTTGDLVDIAASCVVVPRKANQPKAQLLNQGQMINDR